MRHMVSDEFICPKCKEKHMGAAVQVLDFIVCTDCFYNKYQKELEPIIKEMVLKYFNITQDSYCACEKMGMPIYHKMSDHDKIKEKNNE